ncbi:MAG: extra-cytoplasmic solute receptor [Betaproteobacteria bacterium]|nr:extra-cytoplasmic solute receptor [Betaproteobacteria bacterium]
MRSLVLSALVCASTGVPAAQTASTGPGAGYPVRPIRIIVPGSAGSANDFTARAIAQRFTEAWGQQIVIDNRTGAGGIIAHDLAAKAPPDGYTLIFSTSAGLVINPLLYKVPYDSFRDFAPISLGSINPQMLFSHPGVPAAGVQELVALARAKPGQLNCASAGTGTPNHLGCELLKSTAKIDFVHVPYKGATQGITDVVAGQAQFMFNSIPAVLPLAKSGKIRALGVGGVKRSVAAPDVPTIAETLPGFECVNWYAMLAPAKTPPATIAKLNAEMVKMIADPPFAQRLIDLGSEPQSSSPAELRAYMRKETERWDRVIKAAGLKIER